ncbi:hypothetical protein D3C80_1054330 [compost metagenome]
MIGADAAGEALVLAVEQHIFGVGRGAVDDLVQTPAGEGQAVQFAGGEQAALEHLRQQAAVAGLDHRQFGDVRAVAQFGVGGLDLGGQAQAAELVRGAAVVLYRQQVGAGAPATGVELDPEHAQGIEAEADRTFGVAGLDVEEETLAPFFALVLAIAFAEITIQVDIGHDQVGAAVFDKSGLGGRREQRRGYG